MKRFWFLLPALLFACALNAQDPNLANQYYSNGEYEKAAVLYEQIFDSDPRNDFYYGRYVECMLNLSRYEECEKSLKKQIKKTPENTQFYVWYGNLYERQGKIDQAKTQYQLAVDKMAADYMAISRLANTFMSTAKYDYAIATYERGSKLLNDPNRFAFNLGELYRRDGNTPKMIEYYLNALESDAQKMPTIQTFLARFLAPEDFPELQSQLYTRIQKSDNPDLVEILAWSFVTQKDFKSALRQYKALDKRLGEIGQRVYRLGNDAADNQDYATAIEAYEYIIKEKGPNNLYFFEAKREVMDCRRKLITEGYNYTQTDLISLETEYEDFIRSYGIGKQTAEIVQQLANLEAYYLNNLPKAIQLLETLKSMQGIDPNTLARTKINLADIYLMQGEVWESTLLYSQVDKAFKEEQIGQEARFKNARLAYFNGDFQWAQAQFDVLKASTSKLIANDALDLSVFIMDNLNLDTTSEAISLYAGAELLVYQNLFDQAFLKLDSLQRLYPDHMLQDDILYLEAQIYEKKHEWVKAASRYQVIGDKYPQDIRADNALFALAGLYENQLKEPQKAMELYERIFMDYSGSVFAVEARKRYRILRGDKVQ